VTDHARPRLVLAAMDVAGSVILVDQTAVPLATSHIVAGLHGSVDASQWILTANLLPLAAFMVVGGRLGDLFGLRRVFLWGAAGFAVATVLATAAQDMTMLIGARVLQGASAALVMPNSVAIVSSVFPAERRGSALGLGALALVAFVAVESRVDAPLIDLRLLRHANFLAANVSQVLSGMIELGLGYLLPFQLLLVVGVAPATAGLALLPASVPIILSSAGPSASRCSSRWSSATTSPGWTSGWPGRASCRPRRRRATSTRGGSWRTCAGGRTARSARWLMCYRP